MKKIIIFALVSCFWATPVFSTPISYSVTGLPFANDPFSGTVTGNIVIDDQPMQIMTPDPDNIHGYGNVLLNIISWDLTFNLPNGVVDYAGTSGNTMFWFQPDGNYVGPTCGLLEACYLTGNTNFLFEVMSIPDYSFLDFQAGTLPSEILVSGMPYVVDGLYPSLSLNYDDPPVPEPSSILLFVIGLIGLTLLGIKKRYTFLFRKWGI